MDKTLRRLAVGLGVIIGLVYLTSLGGSFHFDDSHSVEANVAIRTPLNIPQFWIDARTSSFIPENRVYRPLVYTFYSFCWAIGGGSTLPFHVMKIVMHWLVALGLLLIWRRLWQAPGWFPVKGLKIHFPLVSAPITVTPTWAAFLLAVIFSIHPAGSECVDYISATTSLQCAMFYVWAFYAYLIFRDSRDPRKLVLSLFLYFLSVASKEEGITLPAMILITELFLNMGEFRKRLIEGFRKAAPYAVLGLLLGAWIYLMRPESGNESRGYHSSFEYFITQWRAYLWYMRLWFWPWDLNADDASMEFSRSLADPLVIQAAIGNLFVLVVAWFNRKRFPALLYGILWFYITISPASSVVVLAEAINEHRMYLSYVGFAGGVFTLLLAAAEAFFETDTRARRLGYVYAAICVGLAVGTLERNRVWANDENLWLDTVEKNPTSGRALNNLALVYMGRGEYDKAVTYFEKCEQHWATYMYCPLNRGIALRAIADAAEKGGRKEEAATKSGQAEKALLYAYQLNPRNVHANFHLGKLNEDGKKDYARAAEFYRTAIALTGGRYPDAELRLASCLLRIGKDGEADQALARAVSLDPENVGALFERGRIELEAGRPAAAAESYRKILQRNPRHVQAWYNYGVSLVNRRAFPEARKAFEKTVELDPSSAQGWYNLAFTAEQAGDGKTAITAMKKLQQLDPGKQEFQIRLQDLQKKFGGT